MEANDKMTPENRKTLDSFMTDGKHLFIEVLSAKANVLTIEYDGWLSETCKFGDVSEQELLIYLAHGFLPFGGECNIQEDGSFFATINTKTDAW